MRVLMCTYVCMDVLFFSCRMCTRAARHRTARHAGDDLSGVNKAAVIGALKHLQVPGTGCFKPTAEDEADMRFLFCACAISALLGDWSGVDKDAAVKYIQSCQSYDGGGWVGSVTNQARLATRM